MHFCELRELTLISSLTSGGRVDAGKSGTNCLSGKFLANTCHREWDVAAGVCIVKEAGGLVTTANPPENPLTAKIEEARLGSRLYLAIRPAGDSPSESAREGQERTVREVWRRVRQLDYSRPGA